MSAKAKATTPTVTTLATFTATDPDAADAFASLNEKEATELSQALAELAATANQDVTFYLPADLLAKMLSDALTGRYSRIPVFCVHHSAYDNPDTGGLPDEIRAASGWVPSILPNDPRRFCLACGGSTLDGRSAQESIERTRTEVAARIAKEGFDPTTDKYFDKMEALGLAGK